MICLLLDNSGWEENPIVSEFSESLFPDCCVSEVCQGLRAGHCFSQPTGLSYISLVVDVLLSKMSTWRSTLFEAAGLS